MTSATQTGFSPPSRSTVAVSCAWWPQSASSMLSTRDLDPARWPELRAGLQLSRHGPTVRHSPPMCGSCPPQVSDGPRRESSQPTGVCDSRAVFDHLTVRVSDRVESEQLYHTVLAAL